jgi:SAM-dependent methyltransferase
VSISVITATTNLEEYLYPDLYDLENPDYEQEGSFYLSIAREVGGPVLELGCGTGRVSIPLAQNGLVVTGLDVGFVVSLFFPHPGLLCTNEKEKEWFTYKDGQGGTIRVSGTEKYESFAR